MDFIVKYSQQIVKLIFFVIIPAGVIYLKLKKKISTGFTVGLILTSFVLSLLVSATLLQLTYDDPVEKFETLINLKKTEEAKKALKIIVQYGPERVLQIDEENIIYTDNYQTMKQELIDEYEGIAYRYLGDYSIDKGAECKDIPSVKKNLGKLRHARVLAGFSESLGARSPLLKNNLDSEIKQGEKILSSLESKCE